MERDLSSFPYFPKAYNTFIAMGIVSQLISFDTDGDPTCTGLWSMVEDGKRNIREL